MEKPQNYEHNSYFFVVFGPPASGKTTFATNIFKTLPESSSKQLLSADCCEEYLRNHSIQELKKLLSTSEGWNQLKSYKLKRSIFEPELWKESRMFIRQSIGNWLKKWNIFILEDDLLLQSQRKKLRQLVEYTQTKYAEFFLTVSYQQCIKNLEQRSKSLAEDEKIPLETVKECFEKFQVDKTPYIYPINPKTSVSWDNVQKLTKKVIVEHPEQKSKEPISEQNEAKDLIQHQIRSFISEIMTNSELRKKYFGQKPVKEVAKQLSKIKKASSDKHKSLSGFIAFLESKISK